MGPLWASKPGRYTRAMPDPGPSATSDKRELWEERYRRRDLSEFFWYRDDAPPELVRLVDSGDLPSSGGALDLGCGPGVTSVYLAQHMRPTVGVDIAHGAVVQAKRLAEERDSP